MKKVLTKKKVCCSLEKDSIFSEKITLKSAEELKMNYL